MPYIKGRKVSEIEFIKQKYKNAQPSTLAEKIREIEETIKEKKASELRKKQYNERREENRKLREEEEKEKKKRLRETKLLEKEKSKTCPSCNKRFYSRHKKQKFCNMKCMHQFHDKKKKLKRMGV